jgi:uncharacterized membrane protein
VSRLLITCLLWFATIGCGLLAGVYFAFSTFIMTALGRIEPVPAIRVMNSINSTILHSWFMPFFYGTTLASLMLVITGLIRWGEPGAMVMLAGGLIFVAGMFFCTVFFNVPLNNALATIDSRVEPPRPFGCTIGRIGRFGTTYGRFRPPPPRPSTSRPSRPNDRRFALLD